MQKLYEDLLYLKRGVEEGAVWKKATIAIVAFSMLQYNHKAISLWRTLFMFTKKEHRNSQKRFYHQNTIYFVTTVTYKRWPYFKEKIFCGLLMDVVKDASINRDIIVYGCVVLYDHVHLLFKIKDQYNVSQAMQYIKRHFSRNANLIIKMAYHNKLNNGDVNEGEICKSRLHLHEHKINQKILYYKNKFGTKKMRPFKWQKSFHDHIIRDEKDLIKHIQYIKNNPSKHGIIKSDKKYKWMFICNFEGDNCNCRLQNEI